MLHNARAYAHSMLIIAYTIQVIGLIHGHHGYPEAKEHDDKERGHHHHRQQADPLARRRRAIRRRTGHRRIDVGSRAGREWRQRDGHRGRRRKANHRPADRWIREAHRRERVVRVVEVADVGAGQHDVDEDGRRRRGAQIVRHRQLKLIDAEELRDEARDRLRCVEKRARIITTRSAVRRRRQWPAPQQRPVVVERIVAGL